MRSTSRRTVRNAGRALVGWAITVVIIGLLVLGAWAVGLGPFTRASSTWSAVFLGDGEIFFGHVYQINNTQIELQNVFYLQRTTSGNGSGSNSGSSTSTSNAATQLSIADLVSNQIQCPKDNIWINRQDVLYWQELQDSSYVVQRLNSLVGTSQKCFQPSSAPAASTNTAAPVATSAPAATSAAAVATATATP